MWSVVLIVVLMNGDAVENIWSDPSIRYQNVAVCMAAFEKLKKQYPTPGLHPLPICVDTIR